MNSKKPTKKVLIIVQNLSVPRDKRVWREAKALKNRGHNVFILCSRDPGQAAVEILNGIRIQRCRIPNSAGGIRDYVLEYVYSWLVFSAQALRLHRHYRFDAIQVCNPPDFFFHIGWLCKLTRTAFVYDQHDLCPELFLTKFPKKSRLFYKIALWMEGLTCKAADVIFCTNTSYAKLSVERHTVSPEKTYVVRNGAILEKFENDKKNEELKRGKEYLIVYAGEISDQDGVDILIRTIHHIVRGIGRRNIRFAILGDGPALTKTKALSEKLQVSDWIDWLGWVDQDVLATYVVSADLCVSPEPSNPLNDKSTFIKVIEYIAAGSPVAAFSLPETIATAGDSAVYAQPNDYEDMADKILYLLDNELERENYRAKAEIRKKKLAWSISEAIYIKAYDFLLNGSHKTTDSDLRGWDYLREE